MSNPCMQHYLNNFRVVPSRSVPEPSHISAPISSTPVSSPPVAPIFQQTTITPNISLQHLYADVKAILQSVEASLEEQKKISKDLNDLSTTVNVLEGVLCGNVGPGRGKRKKRKKKEEIMDLDTLQSEGGIVRRLATIDGAINHLLARLDTASHEHLPATAPPQGLLKFRPFPFVQHSSETFAPAVYPFTRSQKYNHRVQRNSGSPESTESQASPDSTISPSVFNHVPYPAIAGVSSRSATLATLRTRVPIDGSDLSSPLPTPSPETPSEESFSRANDSNSRSWAAPQLRRDTTSLRAFPNSLLNPISPSSTNPIHKPTRTSTLSALRSLDHKSNPASNFTHTVTLPSTSSTSVSSAYDASSPVSRIAPIAPTSPSSSLSSSARTANMHLASPPTTPTSTLARAHATTLYHILPQVYQDIGGDVDCEGPCMECKMRRYEYDGRRSQSTDSKEQSAEEEPRDQSMIAGSSRICLNTSSGGIGTPSSSFSEASLPAPEAQPEVPGIPPSTIETQSELDHPSRSFEANAEASPHVLEAQLEGLGIEPEIPLLASEARPEELRGEPKATASASRASSRSPSHAIDLDALQRLIHGHTLPPRYRLGTARTNPRGSEHMWMDEYGEVNGDFGGPSLEESLWLGHTPDAGGSGEPGLDSLNEPGHDDFGECEREQSLQIENEGGGLEGFEESFKSTEKRSDVLLTPSDAHKPTDTRDAFPQQYHSEQFADSEDRIEPEPVHSELRQPSPSDPTCLNPYYLDRHGDLHAGDSREQTPADSLERDEEAVVAALTAPSPSAESRSPPLPSSPEGLSVCLPLQPESEASCPRVQDQGDGPPSQEPTEILDDGDNIFTTFIDFTDAYTDGATSALRSTYTEDLAEQEPAEMHVEHEPAVTVNHQIDIESEITTSAELSAQLEHTASIHSPPTFVTPPPCASPSSLTHLFRSLSPLSSLGDSPPALQEEINAGSEEGQEQTRVELCRAESLDSDEDFGVYQCRARSASSVSVMRRRMLLRSLQSGELRGGPGASIEELSVLAKKNPLKIMISELKLKRKLESLESAIQSRPPKKKTRFHADMDATSFNTDDVTSSYTYLAHQLQDQDAGHPVPRSSDPSGSAEDVMPLEVENISVPMEVNNTNAIGTMTISEPAQTSVTTSEMTEPELAATTSKPREDSISRGKRVRPLSWKASQVTAQKNVQRPERNGKPKSRQPQKRKSKSLAVQEEFQMCQWPAKSEQDGSFQRQFVQCDNCDLWYHFGCAGFSEGDPRLEEPDSVFICPPCCVSSAKRHTLRRRTKTCARPDCSLTKLDTDSEEYVIERLVGRKTIGDAGYLFLVKWEGYPIAQASWIPGGNIGGVSRVFDRFVEDATTEGIDLNLKGVVLLEEARHGGWNM